MMTVMMTVVAVAYWRWDSRVTERNISFRSEVFTTAQESELKDTDIPTLHQLNEEYSKVAQLVERVLVSIDTTGVTNVTQPSEDGQSVIEKRLAVHGLGSGVIVTKEGHIITAYHVIQNKHALRVTLSDGRSVSVHLVGVDPELDIAVLKVDKPDNQTTFNPLPFGNSDKVAPGMIVLACGNPYGLGTTVEPLKKLVDSGLLGWPLKVTISGATGFTWKFFWVGQENLKPQPVPEELDYDMWLGPAPYKPYNKHRVHATFRGYWDYDGGGLTDMGQHYMDPVQYLLGKDDTSPVKIEVDAPQQHPDAVGIWRKIVYTYDDGCQIVLEGEGYESKGKVPYIEGPLGKVYQGFECTIPDVMEKIAEMPDPEPQNTDFLACVRNREPFALDELKGHRSSTLVNLGACALRLNRTLHFDPDKQLFVGDEAANRLIDQPMRTPWKI